jgi:tetratricopeptide (TPR) repeat protein
MRERRASRVSETGDLRCWSALRPRRATGWLCLALLLASACAASQSKPATRDQLWQQHYDAGKTAYEQGQYTKAEKQFGAALKEAEGFGPDDLRLARSLNNLAAVYAVQGKYDKAEPLYKQSLTILEKALGPEDPRLATCLENYGALLQKMGRTAEAETLEARAQAIRSHQVNRAK